MPIPRLAILLLASWAAPEDDPRAAPEAPTEFHVVRVMARTPAGDREARELVLEIPAPPAPAEEDDGPPPPRPPVRRRINIRTTVVAKENFDRWLYGDPSAGGPRRHLDEVLDARVRDAARDRGLTEAQRAKLMLAGHGDIKRFLDRVEDRRRTFEGSRRDFPAAFRILQGLAPLSQTYREGPFGDGSLFAKTLRKIDDERKAGR